MSQASGDRGRSAKKSDVARKGKERKPGSSAVSGTVVTPESPAAIEKAISERRAHLAATIDELALRAQPKEIARRTTAGLQARLRGVTHTPDGQLRTERLVAVGGAVTVVLGLMVLVRRRRSKK
jgi:uncharacterized protein DUF3618